MTAVVHATLPRSLEEYVQQVSLGKQGWRSAAVLSARWGLDGGSSDIY